MTTEKAFALSLGWAGGAITAFVAGMAGMPDWLQLALTFAVGLTVALGAIVWPLGEPPRRP